MTFKFQAFFARFFISADKNFRCYKEENFFNFLNNRIDNFFIIFEE